MDRPDNKNFLLQSAAMLSEESIILINKDGKIIHFNEAALNLFETEDNELNGKDIQQVFNNEKVKKDLKCLDNGKYLKLKTFTGKNIIVTSYLRNLDEEFKAVFLKDITDKYEKEKKLLDDFSTLSNIMNSSSEYSIIALDLDLVIIHFNPAAEKLFNKNKDDFMGNNLVSLYPDRKIDRLFDKVNKKGKHEFVIEREDYMGMPKYISSTIMKLRNKDGKKTGYIVFSKDISEFKRLEKHLHQAQKMEAIGTLASGISHDFNNILSAVFGNIQLAMNNPDDRNKVTSCLENIQQAGVRAKDLIQQILTFSKQENPDKSPINLSVIISEVTGLIRAATPSNINIETDIEKETSPIYANQTQIHQVLFNLCTNSVHAIGSKKGTIKISLRNFSIPTYNKKVENPATFIKLVISDTGCGMDEKTISRMFDPYYTTKGKGDGTGMGLATVHGIIENHRGIIYVRSKPDKGTDFEIHFPVSEIVETEKENDRNRISTGNEHILLVDDEISIVESVRELIEELGYEVTTASDPVEALKLFKENPENFDLVMTDKTMPEMSGLELSGEILKIRKLPIILCSGFMENKFIDKCRGIGVSGFLKKPFLLSDMAKLIRDLL